MQRRQMFLQELDAWRPTPMRQGVQEEEEEESAIQEGCTCHGLSLSVALPLPMVCTTAWQRLGTYFGSFALATPTVPDSTGFDFRAFRGAPRHNVTNWPLERKVSCENICVIFRCDSSNCAPRSVSNTSTLKAFARSFLNASRSR